MCVSASWLLQKNALALRCLHSLSVLVHISRLLPKTRGDTQVNEGGKSSTCTSSWPACGHGIPGSLLPSKENRTAYVSSIHTSKQRFSSLHFVFSCPFGFCCSDLLLPEDLHCSIYLASLWLFICFFHGDRRLEKALVAPLFLQ